MADHADGITKEQLAGPYQEAAAEKCGFTEMALLAIRCIASHWINTPVVSLQTFLEREKLVAKTTWISSLPLSWPCLSSHMEEVTVEEGEIVESHTPYA